MESGVPNWVIGVLLSFGGCTLSNLGVNMQKFSHTQTAGAAVPISPYRHPFWTCGLILIIVGSLSDLVSFGFAEMSLLAPLGAMTLVVNLFIAPCFNGETLSSSDVFYTMVILSGTVISISFGNKTSRSFPLNTLIELYTHVPFIIYFICFLVFLVWAFFFLRNLRLRREHGVSLPSDPRIESVAYPCLAGVFGAHSVLFAKSTAEIVKQTVGSVENPFQNPTAYLIVLCLGFFLFLQMRALNEGLSKADALIIVPVYQVCWVIMNTVVGMIYFEDYDNMPALNMFLFFFGVLLTLVGVYLLSDRASHEKHRKANLAADATINSTDDLSLASVFPPNDAEKDPESLKRLTSGDEQEPVEPLPHKNGLAEKHFSESTQKSEEEWWSWFRSKNKYMPLT